MIVSGTFRYRTVLIRHNSAIALNMGLLSRIMTGFPEYTENRGSYRVIPKDHKNEYFAETTFHTSYSSREHNNPQVLTQILHFTTWYMHWYLVQELILEEWYLVLQYLVQVLGTKLLSIGLKSQYIQRIFRQHCP